MIKKVLIAEDLIDYLEKRNLSKQYKKAKKYLLNWLYKKIQFKLKRPKENRVYYFRINKQYRAFCLLEWSTLKIFDINDHQN